MGIATLLVEEGVVVESQMAEALEAQRATGERLDVLLSRMGAASSGEIVEAVSRRLGIPRVDLSEAAPDASVIAAIPPQVVFKRRCVPVSLEKAGAGARVLTVATSDPLDGTLLDELHMLTNSDVRLVLADDEDVSAYIREYYGVAGDTLEEMAATRGEAVIDQGGEGAVDDAEAAQEASVIRLVNELLFEAIDSRATDVHIEPYEDSMVVRYRVDGVLVRAAVPPTIGRFAAAIVSRIKVMAGLNIAEKRKPQDGRITLRRRGRDYDLRVSVIPMLFGEGVVLRILNKDAALMDLADLGMPPGVLGTWDGLIRKPHGILLVTGPTGSGKSTTLYASLNRIVTDEIKAITVEDPVEYHVPGVNQIQVNSQVGLTFAAGLRSILRHDPDVIMIGEIRDLETATAAVQASLTGHLVFSTHHTNDAAGALPRLLDMGIEPFLVASSVEGVLAQRLVRRICSESRETYVPEPAEVPEGFEMPESGELIRGVPAKSNAFTGYRGRVGLYELLAVTEQVREDVMHHVNATKLAAGARERGELSLLVEDGFEKVRQGMTTLSEVMRVSKS
jgi:general secretion pathway protein E/type IV pilus assembly protein PilB